MALSDACFEFLMVARTKDVSEVVIKYAATEFGKKIAYYSQPPFNYGDEIEMLGYACVDYIDGVPSANDGPLSRLMFLAEAVQEGLDMPPGRGKG